MNEAEAQLAELIGGRQKGRFFNYGDDPIPAPTKAPYSVGPRNSSFDVLGGTGGNGIGGGINDAGLSIGKALEDRNDGDSNSISPSQAKDAYDIQNQARGGDSMFDKLSNLFGGGGGGGLLAGESGGSLFAAPAGAEAGAGSNIFVGGGGGGALAGETGGSAFALPAGEGAAAGTNVGVGAGSGGGSVLGFLGPLGVMAAFAYLGYQTGEAYGDEYDANAATPARQQAAQFFEDHPDALTNEGIDPSIPIHTEATNPGSANYAPWDTNMGNFRYNPDTRRYETPEGLTYADYMTLKEAQEQAESTGD